MTAASAVDRSVLALRLREFARQPVAEQARLLAQLEDVLASAIAAVAIENRVVLQGADGMAVVLLSGPREALRLAGRAQRAGTALPLCVGINHGPVRLASGTDGGAELMGDGIAAAWTLAGLATRGRAMASRSFRDALRPADPAGAEELRPAGVFTDESVRSHELFVHERGAAVDRGRRLALLGALAVAGILGAGIAARTVRMRARRPAILLLDITPRGEVFVDGVSMGMSPPLERLEVAPGPHAIEVRNRPQPPLRLEAQLQPAQELKVTHVFASPKKREKKEEGVLEGIRRRLGL